VYLHGVIANGLGQTATSGLNNLDEGKFYEALETGYKTGEQGDNPGNYRLSVWHNNREGGSGYGVSVGFDQEIGGGWAPFARLGYGEKDAVNINEFVSLGIANVRPFGRRGDMFGFAGTYGHPSDESLREEWLFETFYRVQLTESLQFSPDIQWINHPAFQPDVDNLFVFGMRLKFNF
jgi:porin